MSLFSGDRSSSPYDVNVLFDIVIDCCMGLPCNFFYIIFPFNYIIIYILDGREDLKQD